MTTIPEVIVTASAPTGGLALSLIDLAIVVGVTLTMRAWRAGAIQAWVARRSLALPRAIQWLPPVALGTVATALGWLVFGVTDGALMDTLARGGIDGALSIALWAIGKRVAPVIAVRKVASIAATVSLLAVLGCGRPANDPRAVLATAETAVIVTDAALAAAIDALPPGQDPAPWAARVSKLNKVADALRKADATLDDACAAAIVSGAVGLQIGCTQCQRVAGEVQRLACEVDE